MSEHEYTELSNGIRISVRPIFLEERSSPTDGQYFWAYHIRITNEGGETVQLVNRYWRIMDARGRVQEVRGAGVVGEQPVLRPGDSFEYTSGAPLNTPSGIMMGAYEMEREDGDRFDVSIPTFSLDSPHDRTQLN